MKRHLNMTLFPFLLEVSLLNSRVINLTYENGSTVKDILFEGSKNLSRKKKKRIRKLIKNS